MIATFCGVSYLLYLLILFLSPLDTKSSGLYLGSEWFTRR